MHLARARKSGTMRGALFVCLALFGCVQSARAQTRVYVAGDLFAEIMRSSRTIAPDIVASGVDTSPRDGVTIGGGGRIGAFFTPAWSLELGLDFGKTVTDERTLSIRVPLGLTIPSSALQYQSRTSHRSSASSVLLGYHPPPRGRIQAGFRGGVSFMHTERMFTNTTIGGTFSSTFPGPPTISLLTDEYTTVTNGLTATLAAEAAIDVSGHFAIVPEARAHAGGLGGFLLRPGVAARWRW
jgi:hypothetical protein